MAEMEVHVILAEDHAPVINKRGNASHAKRKDAVVEVYADKGEAEARLNELIDEGYDRVARVPRELRVPVVTASG